MPEVTLGLFAPIGHGRGFSELYAVPNPAVNAGFTYTVDGGYWERLASLSFHLLTDSNAANRQVTLTFKDPSGAVLASISPASVQAATLAYDYTFLPNIQTPQTVAGLGLLSPLYAALLQPQWTAVVTIGAKQVGDQVSNIRVYRERFITGPGGFEIGQTLQETPLVHQGQVLADELA